MTASDQCTFNLQTNLPQKRFQPHLSALKESPSILLPTEMETLSYKQGMQNWGSSTPFKQTTPTILHHTAMIAVMMPTCEPHLFRVIEETWGTTNELRVVVMLSSECNLVWQPNTNVQVIEIPLSARGQWQSLTEEMYYTTLRYLYKNYFHLHQWFVVVPANVYVHGSRLIELLSHLDPGQLIYLTLSNSSQCGIEASVGVFLSQTALEEMFSIWTQCLTTCNKTHTVGPLPVCDDAVICIKRETAVAYPTCNSTNKVYTNYLQ